jgi:choice-of-anchor B domain-containing protein
LTVEPAVLRAGDTARVSVTALGPDGRPVPGIQVRLQAPIRQLETLGDTALVALREGEAMLIARPMRDGRPVSTEATGRLAVRVQPAPLTRLDLLAPERLYAGTRATARIRASTAAGPRETEPAVTWRSSDQTVLRVSEAGGLEAIAPGVARLEASAEGQRAAADVRVVPNPVVRMELRPAFAELEVGEVVHLSAEALDAGGRAVEDAPVEWAIEVVEPALGGAARVEEGGAFVADAPGTYRVVALTGGRAAVTEIRARPRPPRRPVELLAHRPLPSGAGAATDLWVFEGVDGRDYAYVGTLTAGTLYAWDVTDPTAPVMVDSVKLDGRRVNDVKINEDATIAVVTSEGASDRRNGITLLDILDPAHPAPITHFTEGLTGGVHNVWVEGDLVYAVHDGTRDLRIVDISDPRAPRLVGRWSTGSEGRVLHDVMLKDGLAYLSYWNDGLIILDVGAGIAGGTPTAPQLVSTFTYATRVGGETYGNTHHAVRYRNWLFVADEIFGCAECVNGPRGYVHVLDVADIEHPEEVAFYRVPEAGAHNMWAEDDRLYVAYYQAGVRILDISGELRGDLWRQGREIGWFMTEAADGDVPNATMAWGPQPYEGNLFVSDLNSGLWVLRLGEDR